jgi:hypothetical protein
VLAVALISLAVGIAIGLRYGGRVALRRLTEEEHRVRVNRAGYGRRS